MPTVTYNGDSFSCTKAVKGANYIKLYDGEFLTVEFSGIVDFSKFAISGGGWTTPAGAEEVRGTATLNGGLLVVDVDKEVGDNTLVKFCAPCACSSVITGMKIQGTTYSIVDASGNVVTGLDSGAWAANAHVALLLSKSTAKAYLQNSAVSDSYTREQTLPTVVKNMYGLNDGATPRDAFSTIHNRLLTKLGIEIVSYAGTGAAGKDNPNSVTFSTPPSVVIMLGYRDITTGRWYQTKDIDDYDYFYMLPAAIVPTTYTRGFGFGQERNYYVYGKKSSDGKTFSWYSYDSTKGAGAPGEQCNESGYEYYIMGLATGLTSGTAGNGGSSNSGATAGTFSIIIDDYGNLTIRDGMTWLEYIAADGASTGFYIDGDDCVRLDDWYVIGPDGSTAYSSDKIVEGGSYYLSAEMEGGE